MRISALALLFFVSMVSATAALAQRPGTSSGHIDVSLTYGADRTNITGGNSFWMQGGGGEAAVALPYRLSVIADVTGMHASSISATQVPLSLVAFTFGPRYTWYPSKHPHERNLSLFGQGLVGAAHGFDSVFPSLKEVTGNASSLAVQAGGGADLALSHRISLRLLQVSWLRTQLPNGGTNVQNHLSMNTGIAFHF